MNSPIKKRARGEEQKKERSNQILKAAASLLENIDYAEISMNQIAEKVGLVKGTLYLYFKTKEELFLALHQQEIQVILATWQESVEKMTNSDQLPDISATAFLNRPLLMILLSVTNQVLEHNISFEMAKKFKLETHEKLGMLATAVEQNCDWMQSGQGSEFVMYVASYATGLWSSTQPAPIIEEVYKQIPELVVGQMGFSNALQKGVRWLYQGMKKDAIT